MLPKHIGLIMDGNGRWGKKKGLSRSHGHFEGIKTLEMVINTGINLGIDVITFYTFSSQNWKRSKKEVEYLMELPTIFFREKISEFMSKNIRVRVSGNIDELPLETKKTLVQAMRETKDNTGIIINFAFNYGGREEIIQATKRIVEDIQKGELSKDKVDERCLETYLYTNLLPRPDLIIRTGGEQRLSNFLLWQSAYTQLYFTDVLFPDFNNEDFLKAINHFKMTVKGRELYY
ncbi:polyprenyl diphosphate synthase [Priestia sp. Y58]|uniref:polyprenyl diphosphate synthase n=1 Tax=Priestia TaxID=2800373 RepID=UPI001C8DB0DF|nr:MULTISPECIES: polyprenyl diphosphate synthase [Priestia]MBX9987288.1 di-trans,poly-cis-decaprenylcistransferase [Priestia aryabhattai]MBX9998839.1 di-trans,poly-cis-decaprenylcistransferase [Priestia aryabhattai]MDG0032101.1 polyprenyl diphosphate synthase [Priestia sp. Y58]MDG0060103.1 polyprenyl diphosphate synthase [Priestia sp. P5]UYV54730.1 polyprenyl diphosphate synthase [Priestia megaterium]